MSRILKQVLWGLAGILTGLLLVSTHAHAESIMGGQVREQAQKLLVTLIDTAVQTGEFIKEQIPIVIKEVLVFHTAVYVAAVVLALLVAGIGGRVVYLVNKARSKLTAEDPYACTEGHIGAIAMVLLCVVLPGAVVAIVNTINLLKITLAPRLWLIEYAASLVK